MPADLYATLGVSRSASADEIKRAYRTRARELHPDVNKAPDAQKRFAQVQEAHEILSDPRRRELYDQFGYEVAKSGAAPQANPYAAAPGSGWGDPSYTRSMDPEDFNDIFNTFFSGRAARPSTSSGKRGRGSSKSSSRGSSPRSHARAPEPDPEPLRIEHSITFLTAARGGRETLKINTGTSPNPITIDMRIPAGILDGDTLRVRAGADLTQDALVTVRVGNHPIFRRTQHAGLPPRTGSLDLYADLPLSFSEAALGAAVPVPTLDQPVLLKVPAGIASGKLLRLQGRGIKSEKSNSGDLYFITQILPPPPGQLTEKDRAFLAEWGSRPFSPRSGNDWPASLE